MERNKIARRKRRPMHLMNAHNRRPSKPNPRFLHTDQAHALTAAWLAP